MNYLNSQRTLSMKLQCFAGISLTILSLIISVFSSTFAIASNSPNDFSLTVSPFLGMSFLGNPVVSPDLKQILLCGNPNTSNLTSPTLRTVDFGQTFLDITGRVSNLSVCLYGTSATSSDSLNIYGDNWGLIQSHDGGLTWDTSAQSLIGCQNFVIGTGAPCPDKSYYINSISTSTDGKDVYVNTIVRPQSLGASQPPGSVNGNFSGPLYISHDFGKTWIRRNIDPSVNLWSLAVTGDGKNLIANTISDGFNFFHIPIHLYFSHDDGMTWQVSANLESVLSKMGSEFEGSSSFTISANGQIIYFAASPVLFVSTDGGSTWALRGSASWGLRESRSMNDRMTYHKHRLRWYGITTSGDGKTAATAASSDRPGSPVYTWFSNDYGKTWVAPIDHSVLSNHLGTSCNPTYKYSQEPQDYVPQISADGTKAILFSIEDDAHSGLPGKFDLATMAGICNEIFYINIPSVFPTPPPNPLNADMDGAMPATITKPGLKSIICTKGLIRVFQSGTKPSCPTRYKLIAKP